MGQDDSGDDRYRRETEQEAMDHAVTLAGQCVMANPSLASSAPELVERLYAKILQLAVAAAPVAADRWHPAVPVEDSVHDEYLVSLYDGKKYKSLKRHLAVRGATPGSYRRMFGLPDDYPMVCAAYSRTRSDMALRMGLGRGGLRGPARAA